MLIYTLVPMDSDQISNLTEGGAALSIVVIYMKVPGGWTEILDTASAAGMLQSLDFSFDLSVEYSVWAGVIGGLFLHAAYFGTDQSQIQRVLTSKSIRESKLSLVLSGVLMIPQMLLFLFIGVLLYVYYQYAGDPNVENLNELFPLFVVNELPAGISGLIIAGVFAAAMSSLYSALNSLSVVSIRDFYSKFYKKNASDKHYLKASRWATVFWGIYATIFAIYWEAFQKEKKRKSIDITFNSSFVIYLPFWIGYLTGKKVEVLPVDAITGKVDLKLKDAFINIIHEL
jgi:solute:Na+ symporter, SSS family